MSFELEHLPGQSRYLFSFNGEQVGLTDYRVIGNAIHISHTEIGSQHRRRGFGAAMVRSVLDEIRLGTGYRVVAACPFVADWIEKHPEYHELELRG